MVRLLTKEKDGKTLKIFIILSLIGCILFLILTTFMMFLYPGGYYYINYFSDLGFQTAHYFTPELRQPNPLCSKIFIIIFTLTGLLFSFFWISLPAFFKEEKRKISFRKGGLVYGILSSIFLMLVAFFPTDIFGTFHIALAWLFFLFFIAAMGSYSILILLDN
ncbi:MAG: DUF998 domain-containing protein [Candidatus Lokiarchaeota archaeon]|nr:DUF998 domain-containing protein [Candidatus Lokiarchaeota archaeon]